MNQPIGLLCLQDLIRAYEAMTSGDGRYFDYSGVVQGYADWTAGKSYEEPTVYVWVEEIPADRGGERAGGGAFRTEDLVHICVHVASTAADNDLMDKMYRIRADLFATALADRSRGNPGGHPNTYYERTQFLYPGMTPEGMIGGTVEALFTIRWDHGYDMAATN